MQFEFMCVQLYMWPISHTDDESGRSDLVGILCGICGTLCGSYPEDFTAVVSLCSKHINL